ncbi:MAG: class 1 fructose-bisphosphatase [Candidatus Peribacteraceae bacterium]|nr:class 1 fructose-bisphosphatase [Candidatus Peribacteraceae bacterium]HCI03881.1 fructose-bisphosphatase class I [Candidatus Peribacteria bacterium]|tara:strand:+ start:1927 stop:2865 length:939 start_codon:yes stop_codon:yes gene_type:complete
MTDHCKQPERISLNYHLYNHAKISDDLRHLILEITRATKYISHAIQITETSLAGGTNVSGEEQLKIDILSNALIEQHLCESNLVCCYSSEEQKEMVALADDKKFSVVFDPLDGCSCVEANLTIGSIFGIYEGKDIIGQKPRDQVASFYVLYGPRTSIVYSTGNGVHEFYLNDAGEFILNRENLGISDEASYYSPGNVRDIAEYAPYKKVMDDWIERKMTIRYSGSMVADINHILTKGQGVFAYPQGNKYPEGKLRITYECGPFSYLVEQAGGASSDGTKAILDKEITDLHQRTPIIIGSKNEVERVCSILIK